MANQSLILRPSLPKPKVVAANVRATNVRATAADLIGLEVNDQKVVVRTVAAQTVDVAIAALLIVAANQRAKVKGTPAPENGTKNRVIATHGQITNGHRMTIVPMMKTARHVAHQNHHPTANRREPENRLASLALARNHLRKNHGTRLMIAPRVHMMTAHNVVTGHKKIETETKQVARTVNRHSVKSHHSAKSHHLARVQFLAINDIVAVMKAVTKAGAIIGATENLMTVAANQPLLKLASQNQSQIAAQAASQTRGQLVAKSFCAGRNNIKKK